MPGRALPKYLAGPPSELSPLPSPPPTHPGGRRRAPCPPRGPQGGPQPPTPALAQLVPDTSCLSRPLCWSERAAELRRWPRGEGGSQGPVAACPAGMGGGWRELGHPSRHLTGGPQESPPLCSKYYRPLETPGNPGQHGAGLVTRGESGLQQLSCFDLGGWGMSRASGTSALWPALPQGSRSGTGNPSGAPCFQGLVSFPSMLGMAPSRTRGLRKTLGRLLGRTRITQVLTKNRAIILSSRQLQ